MTPVGDTSDMNRGTPAVFHTTRWSVVLAAGEASSPESRAALEELAGTYWYPLYAFLRRRGDTDDLARDRVQGFFALLVEKRNLSGADPRLGRFRSYLLTALRNFLANEHHREQALKRGGGQIPVSLDAELPAARYALEPADDADPERLFERSWARSVLERTMERLEADYERRGQARLFRALKPRMAGEDDARALGVLAAELSLTEGAIKVAAHRMRQRFGTELRREIAETVSTPEEVEEELRVLFEALG